MRSLLENPLWHDAKKSRARQRLAGWTSGIFLAIALVALFDGLIAQMRKGPDELELLPGGSVTVSGPVPIRNPLSGDLAARFTPEDAPLAFALEGYFTGYWFGSGMWRGTIQASAAARPGHYALSISFRGAPGQGAQKYRIRIFANQAALRIASYSFLNRWLEANPFILAAACGGTGLAAGLLTYWFGRRFYSELQRLGLAEIYAAEQERCIVWCLAPKNLAPRPGIARLVLDRDGHVFGEARSVAWHKGRLQLEIMDERKIPGGALVCLRHPGCGQDGGLAPEAGHAKTLTPYNTHTTHDLGGEHGKLS